MRSAIVRQFDRAVTILASASFLPLALLILLILATPALLVALAYASPPDPSWIPGIYDDDDYDGIVTLVTSASAHVAPAGPVDSRPTPSSIERVLPLTEHAVFAPSRLARRPRAPPVP
ncbi:MAG TPA: hypothetical protein VMS64_33130 [Candidatus Methylomirabilis sp.]|nr:hypothetical protein [Candidatus Methylomirabilis sp.]